MSDRCSGDIEPVRSRPDADIPRGVTCLQRTFLNACAAACRTWATFRRSASSAPLGPPRVGAREFVPVGEGSFLEPLIECVEANQTPAERKLELFRTTWDGSIDPLFKEFAY